MNSPQRTARIAGLLYALGCMPAPFSLIYLPNALIVPGDATATAHHIRTSALLLRIGIVSDLVSPIIVIFAVLTLYRLFKGVDKSYAVLMVILWLVSVPITFVNTLNRLAALILLSGADVFSAFTQRQLETMALVFLRLHHQGLLVNEIFWGLWLLPYGVLVFKSGFIPRILGVFLITACFAYVAASVTSLLSPEYGHVVSLFMMVPEALGEFPVIYWLLVKGVRVQSPGEPASIPAIAQ